ncbi:MAG: 50S ribosomal protein L4 [Candidatus Adiutrix sp.]|jgi:large subunit ribosomal protein L4|nr:50S ribosomal protein L4 [Candidatus Adiutrix sp.]
MIVNVVNLKNETVGQVELPDLIYNVEMRPHLVHEVVTAQLHSRRAGTACTKTRAEVAFSNRKPFRQKGTGRARGGTRRSPVWRHGGTIFGPKPRDFSWRPSAQVRRSALKIVLSAKLQDKQLVVLDDFLVPEAKTKTFAEGLKGLGIKKAVVVTPGLNENLERSSRNISDSKVLRVEGLNCYDLLNHTHLVVLKESLAGIEARLMK